MAKEQAVLAETLAAQKEAGKVQEIQRTMILWQRGQKQAMEGPYKILAAQPKTPPKTRTKP
eukprot:4748146-Karenia_brevis.AAC.1